MLSRISAVSCGAVLQRTSSDSENSVSEHCVTAQEESCPQPDDHALLDPTEISLVTQMSPCDASAENKLWKSSTPDCSSSPPSLLQMLSNSILHQDFPWITHKAGWTMLTRAKRSISTNIPGDPMWSWFMFLTREPEKQKPENRNHQGWIVSTRQSQS